MSETFLIPDYDPEEYAPYPACPDEEMVEAEKDRLFYELCAMIDSGALDPDRELPY